MTVIVTAAFLATWLAEAFGGDAPEARLDPALLGGAFLGGTGFGAGAASALVGTVLVFRSAVWDSAWLRNSLITMPGAGSTEGSFARACS